MELPEPQTRTFSSLIAEIEKGQIKIPQFQRDFVWTLNKSAALMDSIVKGYPIGTFIFWRTKERLRSVRNLGSQRLPEPRKDEPVDYVLDGQQRLTSLFACLKGLLVSRPTQKQPDDFSFIYIDLSASESDRIVTTELPDGSNCHISILDLLSGDFSKLASYPAVFHDNMRLYKSRIESYQYPIVLIKDAPIDIATEIFTRINVGGKALSLFEVMVAKTFDNERNFDLSVRFQGLIERLRPLDYETISAATVLQTISMLISGECKRQVILRLNRTDFVDTWSGAIDAIERTVEYFRQSYRIPVSQLLPYNALIVPFAYFFYKHKDKPTGTKSKYLRDFFWRCALSGRYSSSVESKLAQDIKRIDLILDGKLPTYDWSVDSTPDFIMQNGGFSASRSYIKAILCLYAYAQPKSFNDNSLVNISNYWLKRANSKNYHHFFPKAHLKKQNEDEFYINHVLNITIVDDYLNKREIRAKPPSKYIKKFAISNPDLHDTLKSHLIGDPKEFGIWDDDFDTFFVSRAELVSKAIRKRIIRQDSEKKGQPDIKDDYEEDPSQLE